MATSTITALTAVTAGNLDDTAVLPVDDKNGNTRKATIAQLRTQIAAAAIAFLSTMSVAGTTALNAVTTVTTNTGPQLILTGLSGDQSAVLGLYTIGAAATVRNWGLVTYVAVDSDMAIRVSTAKGGNPASAGITVMSFLATAVTIPVTLAVTGAFACNGATVRTAAASGGAAAATATLAGYGFVSAAEFNNHNTLVQNIRTALVNNGIMS